jgi:hypothetical protein
MAYTTVPDDILLPSGDSERRPARSRMAAFVPIVIALIGVAAILFGRVTVHEVSANEIPVAVDPITTGSIDMAIPTKADGNPGAR